MMSAGEVAVPVLGLGLGMVLGGFIGGILGTLRPIPATRDAELAVETPDTRVEETEELLRTHDAIVVAGTVTYHENPIVAEHE